MGEHAGRMNEIQFEALFLDRRPEEAYKLYGSKAIEHRRSRQWLMLNM